MTTRIATAWVLVVIVGLLIGLLLLVVVVGVSRHLRRQRENLRPPSKPGTHGRNKEDYEADAPSEFPRHRAGDDPDPDDP